MLIDLTHPVPDAAELVFYHGCNWRVSSWWRVVLTAPMRERNPHIRRLIMDIAAAPAHRVPRRLRKWYHLRLVACRRDVATCVSLTGVCGAFARCEDVVRLGYVEWTDEHIEKERELADWYATADHANLGRGYEDLVRHMSTPTARHRHRWGSPLSVSRPKPLKKISNKEGM